MNAGTGIALVAGLGLLAFAATASASSPPSKPAPGGGGEPPGGDPVTPVGEPPPIVPPVAPDSDQLLAAAELAAFTVPEDIAVMIAAAGLLTAFPQVTSTAGLDAFRSELANMTDVARTRYGEAVTSLDANFKDKVAESLYDAGLKQSAAQLTALAIAQDAGPGNLTVDNVRLIRAIAETSLP